MGKGPLVDVEIAPGRRAKMHRDDALAARLLPGKQMHTAYNKMRMPDEDKSTRANDDFTQIPGVSESAAQALYERGVRTFNDLRVADLSGLHWRARRAIEEWRGG